MGLGDWHARHGSVTLGKVGVLVVFGMLVAGGWYFGFARSHANDDERAVRSWFGSPSGGRAPADVTQALQVSSCSYTAYEHKGVPVFACTVSFEGISFVGCFTISDNEHVDGGWPVSLDGCSSVKWDAHSSGFVDEATGNAPVAAAQ